MIPIITQAQRSRSSQHSTEGILMQNLLHRHVQAAESLGLGVESGWYSTKISSTFVTGPHPTEAECLRNIAELTPVVPKRKL